jgi:hypothetical protein
VQSSKSHHFVTATNRTHVDKKIFLGYEVRRLALKLRDKATRHPVYLKLYSFALAVGSSETSVNVYQTVRLNISEERSFSANFLFEQKQTRSVRRTHDYSTSARIIDV